MVPSSRRYTAAAAAAVEGWTREPRRRCLAASMRQEGRMELTGDGDAYGWRGRGGQAWSRGGGVGLLDPCGEREKGLSTFSPFLEIFIPFLYSLTLLFSTFRSSFCESTKIEITWFSAPGRRVEAHGSQCLVVQQDLKRTGDQMLQFVRATSPITQFSLSSLTLDPISFSPTRYHLPPPFLHSSSVSPPRHRRTMACNSPG